MAVKKLQLITQKQQETIAYAYEQARADALAKLLTLENARRGRDQLKTTIAQTKGELPQDVQGLRVGGVPVWVWLGLAALAWRQRVWQR